ATSAVDANVENAIHGALRGVLSGRTTLLIAHRRSTLHLADRIVVMREGTVVDQGTHEALVARSRYYRSLLSGLQEAQAAQVGDRIEALAPMAAAGVGPAESPSTNGSSTGGVTAAAWTGGAVNNGAPGPGARSVGPPSIGPGLGASAASWSLNLAPTPELLARVAALRPVRDFPEVDLATESIQDRQFNLRRLLDQFHRPLLMALI